MKTLLNKKSRFSKFSKEYRNHTKYIVKTVNTITEKTRDPVNQDLIENEKEFGLEGLGVMSSDYWRRDPKRLLFTLAR